MNDRMDIDQLISHVEQTSKLDIIHPNSSELRIFGGGKLFASSMLPGEYSSTIFDISQDCLNQIAYTYGIPGSYISKLQTAQAARLLDTNVNYWMNEKDHTRMLRIHESAPGLDKPLLRAYLSDRYARRDHSEFFQKLFPMIHDSNLDADVLLCGLSPKFMSIKILYRGFSFEGPDGHELFLGLFFRNSETGHGSTLIEPFLYRSYCKNGLILGYDCLANVSKTHVGRVWEQVGLLNKDDGQDELFWGKAKLMFEQIVNNDTLEEIKAKLKVVADIEIKDRESALASATLKMGLTKKERKRAMEFWQVNDLSVWGLINSLTAMAHDSDVVKTTQRQNELERYASYFIRSPLIQAAA